MKQENHWQCIPTPLCIDGFASDPAGWFSGHCVQGREALFLAHADDGVIWGRRQDNRLTTSSQLFQRYSPSPSLRAVTLQDARLFCETEEVRVWRSEGGLQACRLTDVFNERFDSFDEEQILWGTRIEDIDRKHGYTLVADGRQGFRHGVPINIPASCFGDGQGYRPLRLTLRHYLTYSKDGCARVYLSRLLGLRYKFIGQKGDMLK